MGRWVAVLVVLALSLSLNVLGVVHFVLYSRHAYHEVDTGCGVSMSFHHAPIVESRVTRYQQVAVRHSEFFGNILVIDDDLMLTERDEFSYHEMAAHVPLAYLPAAHTVVIIGGGDGGVCMQVLQHPNVKRVIMVEIDAEVVDISVRHFPQFKPCFDDPRVELRFEDGAQWARAAARSPLAGSVDLVIVDSTDFNRAETLFSVMFYTNLRRLLAPGAVVVLNLSSLSWNIPGCAHAVRRQRRVFDVVVPYQVFQPTYMSGHYGYLFCSMTTNPLAAAVDWAAFAQKSIHTSYYSPAVHWAAFALPPFVKRSLPPFYAQVKDARADVAAFPPRYPLLLATDASPFDNTHTSTSVDVVEDVDVVVGNNPDAQQIRAGAGKAGASSLAEGAGTGTTRSGPSHSARWELQVAPVPNNEVSGTAGAAPAAVKVAGGGDGRLGTHIIAEFHGVEFSTLNNRDVLLEAMVGATQAGNLTIVDQFAHTFSPHGVTAVLVLAESHLAIHTWPELGFAAIDVFACQSNEPGAPSSSPEAAMQFMIRALRPTHHSTEVFPRGVSLGVHT